MIYDENEDLYGEVTFRCKLKDEHQFSRKKWQGIDLGRIELCTTLEWEGDSYEKKNSKKDNVAH